MEFIIAGNGSCHAINYPSMFLFSWLLRKVPFGSFLVSVIITKSSKIYHHFYDFPPKLEESKIACSMGINTDTYLVLTK